jgi:hypothetical protein
MRSGRAADGKKSRWKLRLWVEELAGASPPPKLLELSATFATAPHLVAHYQVRIRKHDSRDCSYITCAIERQ